MGVDSRKAQKSLLKKGFSEDCTTKHIHYFFDEDPGIKTHFSFGSNEELGDTLINLIKNQLRLENADQTRNFLGCRMTLEKYSPC